MAFGLLNVFKPAGPTSHDVVAAVRRGTGERRIGHGGTLDPMADGVLILALGKATRLLEYLSAKTKQYHAQITLGITTDTYDVQGEVVDRHEIPAELTPDGLQTVLARFSGTISQKPPAYSAIKVKGKPAYARSRAGEEVELAARQVTISSLEVIAFDAPLLEISVTCSAGTYIRSLAHDLGQALGCGAVLSQLRRTASGDFHASDAVGWDRLTQSFKDSTWEHYLLPAERAVSSLPAWIVDSAALLDILHGRPIRADGPASGLCRAYAATGELVAILAAGPEDGQWHPHKVLADAHDLGTLASP